MCYRHLYGTRHVQQARDDRRGHRSTAQGHLIVMRVFRYVGVQVGIITEQVILIGSGSDQLVVGSDQIRLEQIVVTTHARRISDKQLYKPLTNLRAAQHQSFTKLL